MTIIILLILVGFFLLFLEFFVFPGVTVAGIAGIISVGTAVYIGYSNYGTSTGNIILALTLFAFIITLAVALRSKTWNKLSLNTAITGNVETVSEALIHTGDKGIAITRLNPIGKALVNNQEVEAHCPGKFVDAKTPLEVVKVFKTYIIVKPLN